MYYWLYHFTNAQFLSYSKTISALSRTALRAILTPESPVGLAEAGTQLLAYSLLPPHPPIAVASKDSP